MSTLVCTCGETFFVGEVPRGAQIRCRRCSRIIDVHDALRTAKAAADVAAANAPPVSRRRARKANASDLVILPESPSFWQRLLGPWRARVDDPLDRPSAREVRTGQSWRRSMGTPVGVAVGVYSITMLALFVYTYLQADRSALGMFVLFAPRWWCLIPWVLLLPAALYAGWRTSLVGLAGAALTLFGVADFQLPNLFPPQTIRRALRVVTYDAEHAPAVAYRIREAIASWNADVVVLQGCSPALADSLDAIEGFNVDVRSDFCAVARLPLEGIDSMPPADAQSLTAVDSTQRAAHGDTPPSTRVMRYHVRSALGIVPVYSVRLASEGKTIYSQRPLDLEQLAANIDLRSASSRAAVKWIDRSDSAFVVAGNFSLPGGSTILRNDWRGLTDAFAEVGTGFGYTMNVGYFAVRSDHVMVTPALVVSALRQFSGFPTSHQPLMVDLDWRN